MVVEGVGPWVPAMLSRPQVRPCYVCRQISASQWEQLSELSGGIARFETYAEAEHAAALANLERAQRWS